MDSEQSTTILIVPGLRGHVPEHWQTLLQRSLPNARTVPPLTEDGLSRAARVDALSRALDALDGPVILVAHSAGVMIVVHWAQTHSRPIKGALLATPADLESPLPEGYPDPGTLAANGWAPIPMTPLPFPSIVAASDNDPLARRDRVAAMARAWDSTLIDVGMVGHLNPAAGFGDWPRAHGLIRILDCQSAVLKPKLFSLSLFQENSL
jgi:predicted alpha/beta hydrolase family esterase